MNVQDFLNHDVSRRQFLESSAKNAAGMAVGMVGLSAATVTAGASETIRLGVIGVRRQGRRLATELAALHDVEILTLCDVDDRVLPAALKSVAEVQARAVRTARDFRRVLDDPTIDAVIIATPDHWHAEMTIAACRAGKDVYVETPLTHTIAEGERIADVVRHTGRIVQVGLQQRSGTHFRSAVQAVQSGVLGAVKLARAWTVHRRKPIGFRKETPPPPGVDYNQWLGPAPRRPFNANRFHHNWRWFWDYGGGELADWGTHLLDVAAWGLGVSLPERIASSGGRYVLRDDRETPDTQMVSYHFPSADYPDDSRTILWEHRLWSDRGIEGRSAAVAFYGEQGTLIVDRGGWKVYGRNESLTSDGSELLSAHCRNFIDCIRSRREPAAPVDVGQISSTLSHLGNIAYRLGREVIFDPTHNNFGSDTTANALLGSIPI